MHKPEDYLHLVKAVLSMRYNGGHYTAKRLNIDVEDLYQVGCIGLIKACRDYDPSKSNGAKFETYAIIKIHGELRIFIRDDSTTVKFSKKCRELAPKVCKMEDPTPEKVMAALDIDFPSALEIYYAITNQKMSFDSSFADPSYKEITLHDVIAGEEDVAGLVERKIELDDRLDVLNPREKTICQMLLKGRTQVQVASEIGSDQGKVSRSMRNSIEKIQKLYYVS